MGTTPVLQISAAGAARPTFADCLAYVQGVYRSIYGQDTYLGNDCQDGQFLALLAQALDDVNGEALAVFNSFSPSSAQGVPLDRLVELNGIRRKRPSYSTAPFLLVGVFGTRIENGLISDVNGNDWLLPPVVDIPSSGQITALGTCQTLGSVSLGVGAVDTGNGKGSIVNPIYGWQSVSNMASASVGLPVEKDSALKIRRSFSTALPSLRLVDGLAGALMAIDGVNRVKIYDNSKRYQVDGIPGNSIAVVTNGGDPDLIARVIELKKGPGATTFGTTVVIVQPEDDTTIPQEVAFFYASEVPVNYVITVENVSGYTPAIESTWKNALVDFVNGLGIGEDVALDQAFAAAKNYDGPGSKNFKIISFAQGRDGSLASSSDVLIMFNEVATLSINDISVNVLP